MTIIFTSAIAVSELITHIVTKGKEGKPAFSIYDKIIAELIQIHENKNTLKTYKIRASRCFCLWASGIGRGLERYRQGFVASRLRGGANVGYAVCRVCKF